MSKTNAERILERAGVPHRLHTAGETVTSGAAMAEALGVPPDRVLRTLVVGLRTTRAERRVLVLQPSDGMLDLKRFARAAGGERARLASPEEAERWTGLRVGGISPLAVAPGRFEVWCPARALSLERVFVSAGLPGTDLELAPRDLLGVLGARTFEL